MKYFTKARLEAHGVQWDMMMKEIEKMDKLNYVLVDKMIRESEDQIKGWVAEYGAYWDIVKSTFPENFFFKDITMHDCYINKTYWAGRDFIMEFDIENGFTDVYKLIFIRADVKDFAFNPPMDWQYTELYLKDGRYDIQFLTQHGYNTYQENRIVADDVQMERDPLYWKRRSERAKRSIEEVKRRYSET